MKEAGRTASSSGVSRRCGRGVLGLASMHIHGVRAVSLGKKWFRKGGGEVSVEDSAFRLLVRPQLRTVKKL